MKRIVLAAICVVLACVTALTVSKSAGVFKSAADSKPAAVSSSAAGSKPAAISKSVAVPKSAAVSSSASAARSVTFKPQRVTGPPPPKSGIYHNVVALGTVRLAMAASQTAYAR